jgi:branched-chain amino acid transport system ATP-binding protein
VECTGIVDWRGQHLMGHKPYEIAHLGLGYVPENRDIFPKLTVHQNLLLGQKGKGRDSRWQFDDMYNMFPRLKERQHTEAGVLSGGEQQMLTLCRTDKGISVLLIEQKLTIAMQISDRALVMGHGSIVFDGTPDSLRADASTRKEWLEV